MSVTKSSLYSTNGPESTAVESRTRLRCSAGALPDILDNVSCSIPDLTREAVSPWEWNPGRRLLRSIRLYALGEELGGARGRALQKFAVLEHRFWSAVTSSEIPLHAEIGLGLLLPHPVGIVIHPDVKIGPNCLLFQQVTLGTARNGSELPTIGGHVDIGAGAKILGAVTIGHHARIGANAVVLSDVPEGAVAAGVPASIVRYHFSG